MKKNVINTVLIIAIAVIGYFTYINNNATKNFDNKLNVLESGYKFKLDSVNKINSSLRDSVNNEKKLAKKIQKEGDSSKQIADNLRKTLTQLRAEKPTSKDALIVNLKAQNNILEQENQSLRRVIRKRDSVITIQGRTINKLEAIIINKDIQFKELDTLRLKTIDLYKDNVKKQRNKGRVQGGIGVLGIIAIILLL